MAQLKEQILCCETCLKLVKLPIGGPLPKIFFCCHRCVCTEMLFQMHWCDEDINRRDHYKRLTRGEGP